MPASSQFSSDTLIFVYADAVSDLRNKHGKAIYRPLGWYTYPDEDGGTLPLFRRVWAVGEIEYCFAGFPESVEECGHRCRVRQALVLGRRSYTEAERMSYAAAGALV